MAVRCYALAVLLTVLDAGVALATPVALVSVGDASPLGLPFSRFSDPGLDDRGRVAFVGGSTAIFRRTPTGIARIVGAGDVVLGRTLAGVDRPELAAGDCLAFRAVVVGGGAIIMRRCGTELVTLAEVGDTASGGARFTSFGADVLIGSGGGVAFTALLEDGATGLYLTLGGRMFTELARTGGPSPAGGLYTSFRPAGVTASGQVGFRGTVTSGPDGLFYWTGSGLAKLAVVGDSTPAGGSYTAVGLASMNDEGIWAFRATVSGDVGGGVFRADTRPSLPLIETVVLRGGATPIGGTFADFPTSLVPSVNAARAVAFRATVARGQESSGVFVASASGQVSSMVAVRAKIGAQFVVRLREVTLAEDGGVVVRATLDNGKPGLYLARDGTASPLAQLGDATDLGSGFRFTDPGASEVAGDAVFLGIKEAVFVGTSASDLRPVATLGEATPLRGTYAGVDPPAGGDGGRITFGAAIQEGRAGEALFTVRAKRPRRTVRGGRRIKRAGRLVDLFSDPLDGLTRPGAGRGGVAFQAGLTGGPAGSGIFLKATTGPLRAIALDGGRAPGGGRYQSFGTPAVVGPRKVAFVAELTTPGTTALVLRAGRRHVLLARSGQDTGTRLGSRFLKFGTAIGGAGGVAFRATLEDRRDGIFFARGGQVTALIAMSDPDPSGGRFRAFGIPAVAGTDVIVQADVASDATSGGLYRISTSDSTVTPIALAASPSPAGGTFLAFGTPVGNRQGVIAYTADLLDAPTATTIIIDTQ
jgi:hypothetical protein